MKQQLTSQSPVNFDVERSRAERRLARGEIRAAYYDAYCNLRDLQDFALDMQDVELKHEVSCALNNLSTYENILNNKKYKWD